MLRHLVFIASAMMSGCTLFVDKVTDISQEPGYKEMVGREFKTGVDTIAFKFRKRDETIEIKTSGTTGMPELTELPKEFPFDYNGRQILGVIPTGSTFKIVRVIRTESFEHSNVDYKAVMTSPGPFRGLEVNPTWLTDMAVYPKAPKFNEKYVAPVI